MKNKSTKLAIIIVSLLLCICFISCDTKESNVKIVFPIQGGEQPTADLKMDYNLDGLKAQQKDIGKYSYVYSDPIETDYKTVEKLGFEDKDETSSESDKASGTRWFKKDGCLLRIDKYGSFTYSASAEETFFEMPLDEKECKAIAKEYLSKLGLLDENISSQWSTNERSVTTEGVKRVIGYGVNMFVEADGISVYGDNQITVDINGNGEVTNVSYSVVRYNSKDKVAISDINDAIKSIDERNCLLDVDDDAKELSFEKVSLAYWSYEDGNGKYLIPIYVFEGTANTTDGNTDSFTIAVQANK